MVIPITMTILILITKQKKSILIRIKTKHDVPPYLKGHYHNPYVIPYFYEIDFENTLVFLKCRTDNFDAHTQRIKE